VPGSPIHPIPLAKYIVATCRSLASIQIRSRDKGLGGGPVNHSEIVSLLWGVADLIRDTFKRGKYQETA